MGVIQAGILSPVSGKVAGVVGGKWKDKAYLRSYVIPANPKTAAQLAQRLKFELCVAFAKPCVGQVFNAYTDKFQKSMSGFNYFIKANIDQFVAPVDYTLVNLTEGKLSYPLVTAADYQNPNVYIAWSPNKGNNGKDDDGTFTVVYDKNTGIFYFSAAETDRSVGNHTITTPAGLLPADLFSFTWCAQYVNNVLSIISDDYQMGVS